MAEELLSTFGQDVSSFRLIPSHGGRFEVTINGEPVYSKLKTGVFPKVSDIVEIARAKRGA